LTPPATASSVPFARKLAYAVNPFGRSVCLAATTTYLMYF
jgi:hypothetical protein